ncbi:MAG: acyl carrier protein [Gemmatimonadaceae bacterium]
MMDSDATWNQLVALVVEATDNVRDPQDVRPESNLSVDLGISSLMAVNLVLELEQEFDIVLVEEDFDHIETVGDLKRLIDGKRAGITQ